MAPARQKRPRRKATLLDVAQRAGVSRGAASLVLNGGESTSRVSDQTRSRILSVAKKLNYQPNALARSLRQRRTNIIGFYRYSETHPFFAFDAFNAAVITGLSFGCHHLRQGLLLHVAYPQQDVREIYRELANGKVDGLILVPQFNDPLNELLAKGPLPVIAIADATPGLPAVTVDDAGGSRLIAAHLAEKGHRRILYRNEGGAFTSTQRRLHGFLDAAQRHGMTVTLGNLVDRSPLFQPHELQLLRTGPRQRPTAIVCWSDHTARHTISHCRQMGLRVPEDVAVVGFDGIPAELDLAYELTTVRAPWDQVAETAMELLIDRIEGRKIPDETVLPVSLVVGDTT